MNKIISLFAALCMVLINLISPAPEPQNKSEILRESLPSDTAYSYDKIDGANGTLFYIGRPDEKNLTEVSANSFGLDESKYDNTQSFNDALAYCSSHPGTKLTMENGTYYFRSDSTIALQNCKNLLIDGNGSKFIFTSTNCYYKIMVLQSEFVELRNLSFDWDWENDRIGSIVKIKNANSLKHTLDLVFTELDNVDENVILSAMTQCDPKTMTMGAKNSSKETYLYSNPNAIKSVEKIADNVLRVEHNGCMDKFKSGEVYMLRHHVYDASVFYLGGESNNITFSNLNIFGSAGMAFVCSDSCSHFQILDTYIGVDKQYADTRHIALGADAIHIADTKGCFNISGCDISAMGDDAVNVHDNLGYIKSIENENTIKALVSCRARVGDTIAFKNKDYYDIDFTAVITSVKYVEDNMTELTFDRPLSEEIKEECVLYNTACNSGNYVIRNNYFHENRARGLLLQSSNGLCENNRFYKTMGQAIKVVMDLIPSSWREGTGVDNLIIRNNEFEMCDYSAWSTVIEFDTNIDGYQAKSQPFTNIEISDNTFTDFPLCAIKIRNTNSLTVKNNTIDSGTKYLYNSDKGRIYIDDTNYNLTLEDNSYLHNNIFGTEDIPKTEGFRAWAEVFASM